MEVFISIVLNMGLVMKTSMAAYWVTGGPTATPWFSKIMLRNRFFAILANFHISSIDDELNQPEDNRDRLFKVRPLLELCLTKFSKVYSPERDLAIDEATCPFKGRLLFKVYNPNKPN
ncbi:PiggyBac transposable element-derived protein 4 [Elysia marginata]|uniref:PiggyBac transposable element-derived protein 4 n=1 Tax=Elysia marginata TaxID=1093978 RepID=A0AAV4IKH1_9GAST|nr:PiggyBac transposable element-derived protein 4 [Elysia marginata]